MPENPQLNQLCSALGRLRGAAGASDFEQVSALLGTLERAIADGPPLDWSTVAFTPAPPLPPDAEPPGNVSMIERAIEIAAAAHVRQTDKAGLPYILHPLRVMMAQQNATARIVAVLHDVCEDTEWHLAALRAQGFCEEVLRAIDAVTRRAGETYEAFVARASQDPLGRTVKIADLEDNSNLARIPAPTAADVARQARYARALAWLKSQPDQ